MMRVALINEETGKVDNLIVLPDDYDSEAEDVYSPPAGFRIDTTVPSTAVVGSYLKNGKWENPPIPEPRSDIPTVQEQLDTLTTLLVGKGTLTAAQVASTKAPRPRP